MRVFNSEILNWSYFVYRLINPMADPVKLVQGILAYPRFIVDLFTYKRKDKKAFLLNRNLFPILNENSFHPFDSHYFYQELWAFQNIIKYKPLKHVDIGSKLQFSGFVSTIVHCEYVDIRPIHLKFPNLITVAGSVLDLPYKDKSLESISSLHVIEHIGLGRYGDPIDPNGTKKACKELIRVLKPGGKLYISVPTGKYRICFNAHRVHPPKLFQTYFKELKCIEFSVIDDDGNFHQHVDSNKYNELNYGCGMYVFTKLK